MIWRLGIVFLLGWQTLGCPVCRASADDVGRVSISRDAAGLMAEADRQAAEDGLKPLRVTAIAAGDLEVRVWHGLGRGVVNGYVLRRVGGIWSATRLDSGAVLPMPRGGWEKMWRGVEADCLRKLPPPTEDREDEDKPGDGVSCLVELRDGAGYSAWACANPAAHDYQDDTKVSALLRRLDDRVGWRQLLVAPIRNVPPLPPGAEQHLLKDTFTECRRVSDVPDWVRAAMGGRAIADVGEKWQETDYIMQPGLPTTRLVFAAKNDEYCLVELEHGGIVYHRSVTLYHRGTGQDSKVSVEAGGLLTFGFGPDYPKNLKDLQAAQAVVRTPMTLGW